MEKFPLNLYSVIFTYILNNRYVTEGFWVVAGVVLLYTTVQAILYYLNIHKKVYTVTLQFPVIDKDETEEAINQMDSVFAALSGTVKSQLDSLFIEILRVDKYIKIQLGSNKKEILEAAKPIFSIIPGVQFTKEDDQLGKIGKVKARSVYTSKNFLPAGKNDFFYDGIINYLSSIPDGKQAGIQLILHGVQKKFWIEAKMVFMERKAKNEKRKFNLTEQNTYEGYRQKLSGNLFRAKINIFGTTKEEVNTLRSFFQSLNGQSNNWYTYPIYFFYNIKYRVLAQESLFDLISMYRERNGSYLTSHELAYLLHPTSTQPSRYQPEKGNNIEATPEYLEEREDNILIGTTKTFENESQKVYFPIKNFIRHMYLIGKTGRGKSTLLKDLISALQSIIIKNKEGNIFVFDPHSELAEDILQNTKTDKNIKYLPLDENTKQVFTINPLFCFEKSEYQKAARRDMLLEIIKTETKDETGDSAMGVPTLSFIKNAIEIAIEFPDAYYSYLTSKHNLNKTKAKDEVFKRQLTLNDLPLIYTKEMGYADLLQEVFEDVTSPIGRYIRKSLDNDINQITIGKAAKYRLEQLLHPSISLVCEGNQFNLENAITSNNNYLIPLPENIYGSRGQRLLLKSFLYLIWEYKQGIAKDERVDTYICIDEFQRAQLSIISTMISEARKHKAYLILANQQLGQLTAEVRDAIIGNIGTIVAFTVGAGEIGAEVLARVLGKDIKENDLMDLPAYTAYLQTENENHKTVARFSFQTIKPEKTEHNIIEKELADKSLVELGEAKDHIRDRLNKKQENPLKYFTGV